MIQRLYALGLGSNSGDAEVRLDRAVVALQAAHTVIALSNKGRSRDWSNSGQKSYLNLVVVVRSNQSTGLLKRALRDLELALGRTRPQQNPGICEIDIDILLRQVDGGCARIYPSLRQGAAYYSPLLAQVGISLTNNIGL
jgi:2-amino-4-hydroxy-6-hydroxymethyldihydropteridine diphosphokinase